MPANSLSKQTMHVLNEKDAFLYGVQGNFYKQPSRLGEIQSKFNQGGFNTIREEYEWSWLEISKGPIKMLEGAPSQQVDFVNFLQEKKNAFPLLLLDYGNQHYWNHLSQDKALRDLRNPETFQQFTAGFINYTRFMLNNFPQNQYFEVWNEWNLRAHLCNGGCPEYIEEIASGKFYSQFLQLVSKAIKTERPQAKVLSQGLAISPKTGLPDNDFLIEMLNSGGLEAIDGIGLHPYHHKNIGAPETIFHYLVATHQDLIKNVPAYAKKPVPFYLTEIGWPTGIGSGWGFNISPHDQAARIARVSLLARTLPFVKGMWLYDFIDDGTDHQNLEAVFGIVNYDLADKPAYAVASCLSQYMIHGQHFDLTLGSIDTNKNAMEAYKGDPISPVYGVRFQYDAPDRHTTHHAVWSVTNNLSKVRVTTTAVKPFKIVHARSLCDPGQEVEISASQPLEITLSDTPLYITQNTADPLIVLTPVTSWLDKPSALLHDLTHHLKQFKAKFQSSTL